MSIESVRAFLVEHAPEITPIALERHSETHTLSAAWGIKPAQIAKTLALRIGERDVLLVSCGDSRLDNRKVKEALGGKPKMLLPEEAARITGHPVGGVCPFGLATALPVYCDILLKRFDVVVTAAGDTHYALRIDPPRLATLTNAKWVDVCACPSSDKSAS
jgi:prolyl-tRNA editing enzyme YbaK/EbsC (Cys-tRNA(Pro) deacylase)